MPNYRRAWQPGGTYFFTVALLQRHGNDLLTRHVELLRECVRAVRERHPFHIHAWVVLPDHLHCVIELPPDDADFATRWRLIKMGFSKALPRGEDRSPARVRRGERGDLATTFLGTPDSGRGGFSRALGLCAYQPGETRAGRTGGRLAVFDVPFVGGAWGLCGGIGVGVKGFLVQCALLIAPYIRSPQPVGCNNRRALHLSPNPNRRYFPFSFMMPSASMTIFS